MLAGEVGRGPADPVTTRFPFLYSPCLVSASVLSSSPVWGGLAPSLGLSGPLPHCCSEVSLLWGL